MRLRGSAAILQAAGELTADRATRVPVHLAGRTTYRKVKSFVVSLQLGATGKGWDWARVAAPRTVNSTLPICIVLRPGRDCPVATEVKSKECTKQNCSLPFYTIGSFFSRGGVARYLYEFYFYLYSYFIICKIMRTHTMVQPILEWQMEEWPKGAMSLLVLQLAITSHLLSSILL